MGLEHRCLHPRLATPGCRAVLFLGQGTLAQHVVATWPVSNPWLRPKTCTDSRMCVPVCVRVSGWVCPCVWVCVCVSVFFLALMGRMKSASWTELGSASFLCLGPKPPEPRVGNTFPLMGLGGGREGEVHERVREGLKQHYLGRADCTVGFSLTSPDFSNSVPWSYHCLPYVFFFF